MIGHASLDENGKIHSGIAGDQTGKEVCIREWYNKNWNVVIRAKDPSMAEAMAKACETICANNAVGYDQYQRNTLLVALRKIGYDPNKLTEKCETDCSAFMSTLAIIAGIPESCLFQGGNLCTTYNMVERFKATGRFEILKDSKYLTGEDYLLRGDILLNENKHTAMELVNGKKAIPETPKAEPITASGSFKTGDKIKLVPGATYSNGASIPKWVFNSALYVREFRKNGDIVISTKKTGDVTGVVKPNCIVSYDTKVEEIKPVEKKEETIGYLASVASKSGLNVRESNSTSAAKLGAYNYGDAVTILEEKNGWGRVNFKGKTGWISLQWVAKK